MHPIKVGMLQILPDVCRILRFARSRSEAGKLWQSGRSEMAEYVVEFGKDGRPVEPDGRLDAPAFHRNHEAIWAGLEPILAGKSGDVVETGSGTGQHAVDFAQHSPEITWWPSDLNEQHL